MIYGKVFAPYELSDQDVVMDLPGGVFVGCAGDGRAYKARFDCPELEPYQKEPSEDTLPGESVPCDPVSFTEYDHQLKLPVMERKNLIRWGEEYVTE